MTVDIFPFNLLNDEEFEFPIVISENSRVKIQFEKLNQELIDKIFPKQNYTYRNGSVSFPLSSANFRLGRPYKYFTTSNTVLKIYRKPTNKSEPKKYNRIVNSIIDSIQLFANITLTDYVHEDINGKINQSGSLGNHRQARNFTERKKLNSFQIESIRKYFPLIRNSTESRINLATELYRNADVGNHNSFGLKCSLLVIIIESFILQGKKSNKENFGMYLSMYLNDNKEQLYTKLYSSRGKYFHSGEDVFEAGEWWILREISIKVLCDFLDDKNEFNKKRLRLTRDDDVR